MILHKFDKIVFLAPPTNCEPRSVLKVSPPTPRLLHYKVDCMDRRKHGIGRKQEHR